jgi:hypothetical protein
VTWFINRIGGGLGAGRWFCMDGWCLFGLSGFVVHGILYTAHGYPSLPILV